jgi:Protein of unknown function (DUF1345)
VGDETECDIADHSRYEPIRASWRTRFGSRENGWSGPRGSGPLPSFRGTLAVLVWRVPSARDRSVEILQRSADEVGESLLLPTLAILGAASLYATLPTRFIAGHSAGVFSVVRWIVPALTLLLLVALWASVPRGRIVAALDRQAARVRLGRRIAVLTVTALVSAANGASIIVLVHLLIGGEKAIANELLRAAVHMWCTNVLLFALWFWELDDGGPAARRTSDGSKRDFLYPQQTPEMARSEWRPTFLDYLYVSFTNATAFSPTDAMPLSRWAKMLMLVEAAVSLVLAIMVAARAVNILH